MSLKIGVIAEEKNDIDVLYRLTCKIVPERSFSFSKFIGHGCGKIRSKSGVWANNLIQRGCSHLVVMHDLDRGDEVRLRSQLSRAVQHLEFKLILIIIPIEELEAWLLHDAFALKNVFNMKETPKLPNQPEKIKSPKEYLRNLIRKHCGKYYVNTIHNAKIATLIDITTLETCYSFAPYYRFLKDIKVE